MASRDEVLIRIRTQGGKASAKEIAAARKEISGLAKVSKGQMPAASRSMVQFRKSARGIGEDLRGVTRYARNTALAITGIGSAGVAVGLGRMVKDGVRFNAEFQDAQTSFTTLLGDAAKGRKLVEDLRGVTSGTPRKLTEAMDAAKLLLGMGMNAEQALATIDATNKAIMASGKGAEHFDRVTLALGQMQAKGKASGEELRQLAEAGAPVGEALKKHLGLTAEQVGDIGNEGVSSAAALWAITKEWNARFSGAAKDARGNWSNQTAQMKKDWEQFQRVASEPLFHKLNKDVAPRLQKALTRAVKTFSRKDLSFEQKAKITWAGAKRDLGPLVQETRKAFKDAEVGRVLRDGIEEWTPRIVTAVANGLVSGAPKVAASFVRAFMDMGTWGKLLTVAVIWRRLRLPFWGAGKNAGSRLVDGMDVGMKGRAASLAKLGTTIGRMIGVAGASILAYELFKELTGQDPVKKLHDTLQAPGKNMPGTQRAGEQGITKEEARARGLDVGEMQRRGSHESQAQQSGRAGQELDDYTRWLRKNKPSKYREWERDQFLPGSGVLWESFAANDRQFQARKRAGGGVTRLGERTQMNEMGPELVQLPAGSSVRPASHDWSKAASRRQRTGAAGPAPAGRTETSAILNRVYLDGRVLFEAMSRQNELATLPR